MENLLTLGVVDFPVKRGDKGENLCRMEMYAREAARLGVNLLLFPEMALTGYENEPDRPWEEKIQVRLSEGAQGTSLARLAALARECRLTLVAGFPEREGERVYNAAACLSPEGERYVYRKLHLPGEESQWAVPGGRPGLLPTPWGPVGLGICYDVYKFPELTRWARRRGARVFLNPTACAAPIRPEVLRLQTETPVFTEGLFLASANLVGRDLRADFFGGSHVLGPGEGGVRVLCGRPFGQRTEPGLRVAQVDLGACGEPLWQEEGFPVGELSRLYREVARGEDVWNGKSRPVRAASLGDVRDSWPEAELIVLPVLSEAEERELGVLWVDRDVWVLYGTRAGETVLKTPGGSRRSRGLLLAESPWGLLGAACGDRAAYLFEYSRAARARGAWLYCACLPRETFEIPWADRALECACATGGMAVLGGGELWIPRVEAGETCGGARLGPCARLTPPPAGSGRLHVFTKNPRTGRPDWRPELYAGMMEDGGEDAGSGL